MARLPATRIRTLQEYQNGIKRAVITAGRAKPIGEEYIQDVASLGIYPGKAPEVTASHGHLHFTEGSKTITIISHYVPSEHQRRGIGARMVRRLVRHARKEGIEVIKAGTKKGNPINKILIRAGFKRVNQEGHDLSYELRLK